LPVGQAVAGFDHPAGHLHASRTHRVGQNDQRGSDISQKPSDLHSLQKTVVVLIALRQRNRNKGSNQL
jgi:hypothetical protein